MSKPASRSALFTASLAGLLLGGGAAAAVWGIHWHSVGPAGQTLASSPADQAGSAADTGTDPAAAWRRLMAGGGQGVSSLLQQADLVSRATARDMPQLLEAAKNDPAAREMLLRRWVELDPSGAAAWLEPILKAGEFPGPEGRENDVEIVFSAWAKTDPAAALAKLKATTSVDTSIHWTGTILTRLLNENMEAGVRFGALRGPAMDLKQVYYQPGGTKWVQSDPVKAAALLSALPAGEFRDRNLLATIGALTKTDLAAAIALQKQFPHLSGETYHQSSGDEFFKAWAEKDPEAVTAYLKDQAPENARPAIKEALAQALSRKDPAAALDWTAANLSGRERTETMEKILSGLTKENPDAALAWLATLSEGTALTSAVKTFTASLPDADAAALLSRAEALPEGAARQAVTAKAYEKMYDKDPEGMIRNLAAQPRESLPEGLWRQLGETTGDMNAGLARLAQLPPEAAPDFVRGVFQRNIDWGDFPKFTAAMGTLTDPAQRSAAMDAVMSKLMLNFSSEMTAWAKTLPPADRSAVADQIEKNHGGLTETQRRELIAPLR